MLLQNLIRSAWQRLLLSGVHYGDRHTQLDFFYRMPDPWQLDCEREHFRFAATNAIILREFGTPAAIVELGCGEGLQSGYLIQVCSALHGIDISPVAVARARERCPKSQFQAGDVMAGFRPNVASRSTLVVACEVIYYVKDAAAFLDIMSGMGESCLVSYYAAHRARLDPLLDKKPDLRREVIHFGDTEWVLSWWKNHA